MALLISPVLARELGASGRGEYAALTAPFLIVGIVGTLGYQDAITQHVQRMGNPLGGLRLMLLLIAPLSILASLCLWLALRVVYATEPGLLAYLPWFLLFVPLLIFHNLCIGLATGAGDVGTVNLTKLLPALFRAVLTVFLCWSLDLSPAAAAGILLGSVGIGIAWTLGRYLTRPQVGSPAPLDTRAVGRTALACFPGVLASMSSARLDQFIGLPLIGARQLGLYVVAVSLSELPLMLAVAGRTMVLGLAESDDPDGEAAQRTVRAVAYLVLCGSIGVALSSLWLIPHVFGSEFRGAVTPCVVLCSACVFLSITTMTSAVLLARGRAASQSVVLIVGAVVGVTALFAFSPLGALGAALASLLGAAVSSTLATWRLCTTLPGFSLKGLLLLRPEDLRWARFWGHDKMPTTGNAP
jgi:O-antigen/teichoic acid export membrane protein